MNLSLTALFYIKCTLVLSSLTNFSYAKETQKNETENNFEKLPIGTIFKKIKVPSYDENLNIKSIYLANLIKKTNEHQFKASEITLKQFANTKTNLDLQLTLKSALINNKNKVLKSYEQLHAQYGTSSIKGGGCIIDLNKERGYIFGPIYTTVYQENFINKPPKKKSSNITYDSTATMLTKLPTTIKSLAISATLSQISNAHVHSISNEKNKELAERLQAEHPNPFKEIKQNTPLLSTGYSTEDKHFENFKSEFLTNQEKHFLIQQKNEKLEPLAPISVPTEDKENTTLKIQCEGGVFHDAKNGVLSYIKNVQVREPRLNIDCDKSLSLHLKKDPKSKKSNIDKIIAIGAVKFQGSNINKDQEKIHFQGSASIIEFDYLSENIILKGGKPTIKVEKDGSSIFHKCIKEDQWILLKKDGSFTIEGGVIQEIRGVKKLK